MARKKGQISKFLVGIMMLFLIVGLAGFGASNFGGQIRSVGEVGDVEIDVNRYAQALNQELQALQAQTGQNITLSQASQFGVDRNVLERLIATAALENENNRIGLSIGDAEVQRQILQNQGFSGLTGEFDRDAYEYSLERNGLTPAQFEETLRAETAGTILQSAVIAGITAPATYSDVMLNYIGQRRNFSWIELSAITLADPISEPNETELQDYYNANGDAFMLPAAKSLTYAWLSPEFVMDQVSVDDETLRAVYSERSDQFNTPERRLVERLVFGTQQEAETALAAIRAGDTTFDETVIARGLTLADIDLGDVTKDSLGKAGEVVFALTEPGITEPLETGLGPALIRVNAILAARTTAFEDVRDVLHQEFAADSARRLIADRITDLDDLLAGGATLEELAGETDMQLGQINWTEGSTDSIAAYEGFANAAGLITADDFPEISELDDGGIFAMRLDELVPEHPETYDNARDQVIAAVKADTLINRLQEDASALVAQLEGGATLSSLGHPVTVQTHATRTTFIDGTAPEFLATVFGAQKGQTITYKGEDSLLIAHVSDILDPDANDPDIETIRTALRDDVIQSLGQDALTAFTRALQAEAGISLNQTAINAVHAQFP